MEGYKDHFLSALRSFLADPDTGYMQSRLILYDWTAHTSEKVPVEQGWRSCRHRKEVLLARRSYCEAHNAGDPVCFCRQVHTGHLL